MSLARSHYWIWHLIQSFYFATYQLILICIMISYNFRNFDGKIGWSDVTIVGLEGAQIWWIFFQSYSKKKKMLGYSFLYNLTYKSTKIYLNVGVFAIEISYFSRRIASKGQYCTPTPLALLAPVSQLSSRAPAPPAWISIPDVIPLLDLVSHSCIISSYHFCFYLEYRCQEKYIYNKYILHFIIFLIYVL